MCEILYKSDHIKESSSLMLYKDWGSMKSNESVRYEAEGKKYVWHWGLLLAECLIIQWDPTNSIECTPNRFHVDPHSIQWFESILSEFNAILNATWVTSNLLIGSPVNRILYFNQFHWKEFYWVESPWCFEWVPTIILKFIQLKFHYILNGIWVNELQLNWAQLTILSRVPISSMLH